MTQHAETRIKERFEQLGYKPKAIKECLSRIDELSSVYPKENVGFLLRKFDKNMVTDFSNGDELWLILRDGRPITCFLRRSTQTNDQRRGLEQQLQVDYTVRLNCLDDSGWKEAPVVHTNSNVWELRPSDPMIEVVEREIERRILRSVTDVLNLGVPRLTYEQANRRVGGLEYRIMSANDIRTNGVRLGERVIGYLESENYVVVTNPAPEPPNFEFGVDNIIT